MIFFFYIKNLDLNQDTPTKKSINFIKDDKILHKLEKATNTKAQTTLEFKLISHNKTLIMIDLHIFLENG